MLPELYRLDHHDAAAAALLLDELSDVYADAYGVGPGEKVDAFRGRAVRAMEASRFELVTARSDAGLIGFVFGYSLPVDSAWWGGIEPPRDEQFVAETGSRTAALSEIEVRRALQRQGIGRRLQEEFLSRRTEERATLATGVDMPSRFVYPRWGWSEVGVVPGAPGAYFSAYRRFTLPLPRPE